MSRCLSPRHQPCEALRTAGERVFRVPPLDIPPRHLETRTDLPWSRTARCNCSSCWRMQEITRRFFRLRERIFRPPAPFAGASTVYPSQSNSRRGPGQPYSGSVRSRHVWTIASELLSGGRRTALPRHQTLRATLDWSYNPAPVNRNAACCAMSRFFRRALHLNAAAAVIGDRTTRVPDDLFRPGREVIIPDA